MKMCQKHWDMLRAAIEQRGLMHLVAKSGEEASKQVAAQLSGDTSLWNYDPLMAANFAIWRQGLSSWGLALMSPDAPFGGCVCCLKSDVESRCRDPICKKQTGEMWIEFAADDQLAFARAKGLLPKAS